jgi:hypothetical protein
MALNSTRPECGTSLILYLGAVGMPRCSSRAQSLSVRTGALTTKECTLRWSCLLYLGPSAAAAPQQASPELLGSQEPPALSQKAPLYVMLLAVRRALTPGVVACFEVPAGQRAVSQCSCMRYGECEPSIIYKNFMEPRN